MSICPVKVHWMHIFLKLDRCINVISLASIFMKLSSHRNIRSKPGNKHTCTYIEFNADPQMIHS